MSQICFIITDMEHKVYYACNNADSIFKQPTKNIQSSSWFNHLSPQTDLAKSFVLHDLKQQGFFNGYVTFSDDPQMYFCDYGKRYDVNGNQIGFDMVLTTANQETADYFNNFYQGIEQRVKQDPSTSVESVYQLEKESIEKNVGTDFSEFLLAILEEHED